MVLSKHEEWVITELEAQFEADDGFWPEQFEKFTDSTPRGTIGRLAPSIACFLGGVALLLAARNTWSLVWMSNVSGFPSASITRAFGLIGCVMVLGSALMLWRLLRGPLCADRTGAQAGVALSRSRLLFPNRR